MQLDLRNLSYAVKGHSFIEGISLSFHSGLLYGLLGPNGSGKSTLLKLIARLWPLSEGTMHWKGEDLLLYSRKEMSRTFSLVPQTPQLHFDFDVVQFAAMGRYPHGSGVDESERHVKRALHRVDAWHLRHRSLMQLSGGERQRIYIARALVTEAPILLLDEPTSHLDLRHQLEIWHLLRLLAKEGKLIIAAVHDLSAAQRFCDKLILLDQGKCKGTGSYDELMTPDLLQEVFGVRPSDYSPHNLDLAGR